MIQNFGKKLDFFFRDYFKQYKNNFIEKSLYSTNKTEKKFFGLKKYYLKVKEKRINFQIKIIIFAFSLSNI